MLKPVVMEGRIKNSLPVSVVALFVALATPWWSVAGPLWSDVPDDATQASRVEALTSRFVKVRRVKADSALLMSVLSKAPVESSQVPNTQIQLPMPDGSSASFFIVESPVMAYELARKYPEIKTYKVRSVNGEAMSGRVDTGPNGFHAYISTDKGVVFIDPESSPVTEGLYNSYYRQDYSAGTNAGFSCGVSADELKPRSVDEYSSFERTGDTLLTYRIAVATTGEYSQAVAAGDVTSTLATVVTAINRVNEIYQRDFAIRLELVANNDQVIYTDPSSDPYTNFSSVDLLPENQSNLDSVLGAAAYDIGHVFNTNGGGLARLGVVCDDSTKAQGESGAGSPFGDPFYVELVAHEIGHQFSANHTFNGTTNSCGLGNRNSTTAYEPGSGTTIMAYAGICGAENIANFTDDTFHAGSVAEVVSFSRSGGGAICAASSATGNTAPVVDAGSDYVIPAATPFGLAGSATDVDGDTLVYQWDEMDVGTATTNTTIGTDLITNALFRSFPPTTRSDRLFPEFTTLLDGVTTIGETLPTQDRILKFRLTVRDLDSMLMGKGGVDSDDVVLAVDGFSGPFTVLQPNSPLTIDSSQLQHVIEWNAACTRQAPVSCDNVDILLTTNGGNSFSSLLPTGSTPNDGTEAVDFPLIDSPNARLKIACVGNIFFDISDVDFALANGSGQKLMVTGAGGSSNCNVPGVVITGPGNDVEPNDSASEAQTISVPFNIVGSINDATDANDFYGFVGVAGTYTFTLSNYGSNDLDLYLMDSSGVKVLQESSAPSDAIEKIIIELGEGLSYYIVVNGFDSAGKEVLYSLDIKWQDITTSDTGGVISYWLLGLLMSWCLVRFTSRSRRISIH